MTATTTTTTTTYKLYWTKADGQASLDMGDFASEAEALADVPNAAKWLLDQCGEDHDRVAIMGGRWSVDKIDSDDDSE